jgi:3-phenylpropionate/trans-cinnamate dioxygenase ferredoxin subunit
MNKWTKVCAEGEMAPGEWRVVWAGDTPIVVLNYDGQLYAFEDRCSHEDFELSAGSFDAEQGFIECALHGARFDVRDGSPLCAPAYAPVVKFPVKIDDGSVWTQDDR